MTQIPNVTLTRDLLKCAAYDEMDYGTKGNKQEGMLKSGHLLFFITDKNTCGKPIGDLSSEKKKKKNSANNS